MKLKYFALAMAFTMALAMTGCSANRDANNTASEQPSSSVPADQNDRPSSDVGSGFQSGTGVGDAIDDIGDAAGDVAQGAGDAIDDVGDAIGDVGNAVGDAANGTGRGRAMP